MTRFATPQPSASADPNEDEVMGEGIGMPTEVRQRIQSHRAVRLGSHRFQATSSDDTLIVDRRGVLAMRDGVRYFVLKGLGRKPAGPAFRLLPCRTREQIEQQQRDAVDTLVFRVLGLCTTFRGEPYILLQRAIRDNGHGNFN